MHLHTAAHCDCLIGTPRHNDLVLCVMIGPPLRSLLYIDEFTFRAWFLGLPRVDLPSNWSIVMTRSFFESDDKPAG